MPSVNDIKKVGMKEQILAATSPQEVRRLLSIARGFTHAHPSTIRKCERAAETKLAVLSHKPKTLNTKG